MTDMLRPILEMSVLIPGVLLSYLPVSQSLRQPRGHFIGWILPLLLGLSALGGWGCYRLRLSTVAAMAVLIPILTGVYVKTLRVSLWKTGSIALSICAAFSCINSFSRGINAILVAGLPGDPWFCPAAGVMYMLLCWLFVLMAWYPATHSVQALIQDDNFARTWYVFWILPTVFIGLNLFMVPRYPDTLYTGRVLQVYLVLSLTLLTLLVLFYALFFMMANGLNRNAQLERENHFLSMQRARYDSLRTSIDGARQARHDLRHHFNRLFAMAEEGKLDETREYLCTVSSRIPNLEVRLCDNGAVDSVLGHYCALAKRESIPFCTQIDLPEKLPVDEMDMCLVLSNLLENALEASLRASGGNRQISVEAYMHSDRLVLIQVSNSYEGEIREKQSVFQSSKRKGNGVGIQSVRRIAQKNGGGSTFAYDGSTFTAKVMLRGGGPVPPP